jgi:carbon-monoxide dehydrogenase large subunit
MDYAVPRADSVPSIDVLILEEGGVTSNPLGVKGVGESGTSGAGAALANAVAHAIGPEIEVTALPVTPRRVWFPPLNVSGRAASAPGPGARC